MKTYACLIALLVGLPAIAEVRDCGLLDFPIYLAESRVSSFKSSLHNMNKTYTQGSPEACAFLEMTESGVRSTCNTLSHGPCKKGDGQIAGSLEIQAACQSLHKQIVSQQGLCSK